jgi:hypothetical protein
MFTTCRACLLLLGRKIMVQVNNTDANKSVAQLTTLIVNIFIVFLKVHCIFIYIKYMNCMYIYFVYLYLHLVLLL